MSQVRGNEQTKVTPENIREIYRGKCGNSKNPNCLVGLVASKEVVLPAEGDSPKRLYCKVGGCFAAVPESPESGYQS